MNYDTVAAISTAQGEGGIGVIRISGDDALRIADKIFNSVSGKKVTEMKGFTLQKEFCVLFSMPAPFRLRQANLQSEHS